MRKFVSILKRAFGRQKKIMSQSAGLTSAKELSTKPSTDESRLIWLDMEMTGLDPDRDRVIEIAVVVTDANLETIAEAPVHVIHQSDEILGGMDGWNTSTHARSGLTDKVRASKMAEADVEAVLIDFLKRHVPRGKSPMCGNSICQDRRFMARAMPKLEAFFHYRNLDVSTLKELAQRWVPRVAAGFRKASSHLAMEDVRESIRELEYYRERLLKVG